MKERPILFSGPMVRAILEGRKTMTRRVCKIKLPDGIEAEPDPEDREGMCWSAVLGANDSFGKLRWLIGADWGSQPLPKEHEHLLPPCICPYGATGDRLWVRETFCYRCSDDGFVTDELVFRADGEELCAIDGDGFKKLRKDGSESSCWIPSIFMHRFESRITLEITRVRVERLQDITDEDAIREGIVPTVFPKNHFVTANGGCTPSAWDAFQTLWLKINGRESWEANPLVWVVEFKRVATVCESSDDKWHRHQRHVEIQDVVDLEATLQSGGLLKPNTSRERL